VIAMKRPSRRSEQRPTQSSPVDIGPDYVDRPAHEALDPSGHVDAPQSPVRGGRQKHGPEPHSTSEANYPVGYGRPPKRTQFKRGQSGNPKGRSPLSRNLRTIVKEVLDEQMSIREGGRLRRMPTIEALVRVTTARAFKGDPKAFASLIFMVKHTGYGVEAVAGNPELPHDVNHEAILEEYLGRMTLETSARVDPLPADTTEASDPSKEAKA